MLTMKPVTIHAAKTQLSRLIARACAGEDIVIARGDRPVVRLVAIDAPVPRRRFGALRGTLVVPPDFDAPLPDDELARWG